MNFNFTPDQSQKDPLKEFGRNLIDEAIKNKLDPVIGRDEEIRRIIRILTRKTKNNPVLVGEPGVGKTAIVEGLAQKIANGEVPENLKDKELYEIDLPSMIAGASYQGQFEQRMKSLMKKVKDSDGKIIIFIDEIHTLIGMGKNAEGGMDAAQIIKPMLARGEMHLIGATTLDEHRKYIESDPALERRMQKIPVNEPTVEDSISILRGLKERLETFHGVTIKDDALIAAVKLSSRYISDRFLPDKAIDLIDEAAAAIQTEMNSMPEELEKVKQLIARLEMEKAALSKEDTDSVKERLAKIEVELNKANENQEELTNKWKQEKDVVLSVQTLKEDLATAKAELNRFQVEGKFEKASEIMYSRIPEIENKLKQAQINIQENNNTLVKEVVNSEEIAGIVSKWTGIPLNNLLESQKEKLLKLKESLGESVKGQDEALELVTDAILRSKANINDPNRPIGSFIFMGPTGVGKTEVARALARNLFDTEKAMIRIDMSEYMEKHTVARLIGSPPGYVGYGDGGQLTEAVRRKPYSIVLFDEIEKAHPDVLNILLQILDDGQVTDSKGKLVNFKNTIVIMTTNLGAQEMLDKKRIKPKEILMKYLRPEFINRIDEITPFNSLNKKVITEIVELELQKLIKRVGDQKIRLTFSQKAIDAIANNSYDPAFGARPIKRYIKRNIESILAKAIISGELIAKNYYEIDYSMKTFTIKDKKTMMS
ncbi:ATP-dependent Clp protease ATP-binding subunit [Mycoplasma todarodis]|uniref:ATP-dependent chaperone ClpB n=1 Tax=Mycoplasma todarodis TaxID=1937191 RepID=A0A4R0XX22_9MOLU|nr:AAA family ATPase [Mycoplasma todarodis]TCG11551.1 ATP-dependent chaperone ClpB [Mycoplasma todarodis]